MNWRELINLVAGRLSGSSTDNHARISRIRTGSGFTLMEVMLGAAILAFVISSTIAVISHSSRYLADLRFRSRATQILQDKVEELRQQNWTQLANFPTTFTDPSDSNGLYRGSVIFSDFQSYGGTTTVRQATVLLTWTNRHDRLVTNTLTTLISNGGLNKSS